MVFLEDSGSFHTLIKLGNGGTVDPILKEIIGHLLLGDVIISGTLSTDCLVMVVD